MERKNDVVDLPCEICNRVDDHYSNLILCDGVDCKREFHMNCLVPPLVVVPPGDWFCPECTKDPPKQLKSSLKSVKSENAVVDEDEIVPEDAAALSPGSSTTAPARKVKKDKQKLREGSLKRRLQSEGEQPDVAATNSGQRQSSKRSRFQRSMGESSAESSPSKSIPEASPQREMAPSKPPTHLSAASRKKPPVIDIPKMTHAQLSSHPDADDDDSEVESDERCLMCGYGGELIVCEFPECSKVYHQFCLGSYPFPKDEDVSWFCPRHTCAISGEKETVVDLDTKGRGASPRKPVTKNLLWKCTQCPLAISHDNFPPVSIYMCRYRITVWTKLSLLTRFYIRLFP